MVGDELPEVLPDEGPEVLLPLEAGDRDGAVARYKQIYVDYRVQVEQAFYD